MSTRWLPLIDYSNKHKISVSTLRRRIKEQTIAFKLDNGRYLILDESIELAPQGRKGEDRDLEHFESEAGLPSDLDFQEPISEAPSSPVFSTAQKLLEELKRAYTVILQEKEEQILQLKEEISDLRTLVRVLESENTRLQESKLV